MKPFRLSRRAVLRGVGACVALPLLDAMLDGRGRLLGEAAAQCAPTPVRLVTFFFPHGVKHDVWTPAQEGPGYAITPSLEPLAAHRASLTVLTGVRNPVAASIGSQGGPHSRGAGSFANGMPTRVTGATGPTFDQVAAARVGGATRFRALTVCADPNARAVEGGSGALLNTLSWSAPGQAVPPERDPRRLFARLFGAPDGALSSSSVRASVLDAVRDEVSSLRGRAGAGDRARLDAHLDALRDLEREVQPSARACDAPDRPDDLPAGIARTQLLLRLVAAALRCDLTRVVSFALANGINNAPLPWLGLNASHHEISHQDDHDTIARIVRYEMEQAAFLLGLLRDAPEGDGTLLDRSAVFISSEVGDGSRHSYDDLPVLLAGRAAGKLRPGAHVRFAAGRSVCDLYLTLLRLACVDAQRFGFDGAAPITEILA